MIEEAEYKETQDRIMLLAGMIATLPLDAMLEKIQESEAVVPILDPTLWIKGGKNLGRVKELVVAFRNVQRVIQQQIKEEQLNAKR